MRRPWAVVVIAVALVVLFFSGFKHAAPPADSLKCCGEQVLPRCREGRNAQRGWSFGRVATVCIHVQICLRYARDKHEENAEEDVVMPRIENLPLRVE